MFEFEKHYFDAIDEAGSLTIIYDCTLRVGGTLRWCYSSRQTSTSAAALCQEFPGHATTNLSLGRTPALGASFPVATGDGFSGRWKVRQAGPGPVTLLALSGPLGREIIWQCHAPICDVVLGPEHRAATGYMETLRLRLPWPSVPIERLHWGRFIGAGRSLVWIVWEGPQPRRLAWLDGKSVDLLDFHSPADATVLRVGIIATGARLDIGSARPVSAPALDERLRSVLGPVRRLLPRRLRAIEDRKSLGTGTLALSQGGVISGTAVFESIDLAG
ncbi:MAG: hypothetical protein JSS20_07865 [Proteobacteria bacterium]|nr:hypothetical protein [Pseudomonadota bacterium]